MNDDILVKMYNAYKKENNIDFSNIETKYALEVTKCKQAIIESVPFDKTKEFNNIEVFARKDEQEKFEEEKKLLLNIGIQIGLKLNPDFIKEQSND